MLLLGMSVRHGPPGASVGGLHDRGALLIELGGGFLGRTDGGPLGGYGWTLLEGTIDA